MLPLVSNTEKGGIILVGNGSQLERPFERSSGGHRVYQKIRLRARYSGRRER
jgi:hypothetical protein